MNRTSNKAPGVTLVELLIGIALLGMIVLGMNGIEMFCRYHFLSSDRKVKVTNEAMYLLEHISKHIAQGIGTVAEPAVEIVADDATFDTLLTTVVDSNQNAIRDAADDIVAYGFQNHAHQLVYYPRFSSLGNNEKLSKQVREFRAVAAAGNTVDVSLTVCWDASASDTSSKHCGTPDNPKVSMHTRINLPAVSTN